MIKNNYIAFLLSVLFISCGGNVENQNIEKENNDQKPEKKKVKITKISDDNQVLNIESNSSVDNKDEEMVNLPSDALRISPDSLTVDGGQRYYLNDNLFTGFSCQYEGDLMIFEIQFQNGLKNGVSRFWHNNGQPKSMLTFKNGTVSGKYKLWDKEGGLVEEGTH